MLPPRLTDDSFKGSPLPLPDGGYTASLPPHMAREEPRKGSILDRNTMRLFVLDRLDDQSGVSGRGVVAEGCEFSNGQVVLCWRKAGTVGVYPSMKVLENVHSHDGKTVVRWL